MSRAAALDRLDRAGRAGGTEIDGRPADAVLTEQLLTPFRPAPRFWRVVLAAAGAGALLFLGVCVYVVSTGVGVWGNNIPVAWGFPIINFAWWMGIAHTGTFVSAGLLLAGQGWRGSINRLAEAMTLFALVIAGLFPILHLGRPWFFYWLFPYPSNLGVWPQFKSPLPWDVFAVTTYLIVSLLILYVGLVPDLAAARDRATGRFVPRVYGVLALGWRGSGRQWHHYRTAYVLLAALATPLVVSISLDLAVAQVPGWHTTLFPPYFVAGALYSGLAMLLIIVIAVRRAFDLRNVITTQHLDNLAQLLMAAGWMLIYCHAIETFAAWYGADPFDRYAFLVNRTSGRYAWIYFGMIAAHLLIPQLFWSRRLRTDARVLFIASLVVLAAVWSERFINIVSSLNRDFLPSSWHYYSPTWVDWSLLLGSIGLFCFLLLLFLRWLPFVALSEVKRLKYELETQEREVA